MKTPKLPHGEGTISAYGTGYLYKKIIKLPDGTKKRVAVRGKTPTICMQKMREKEAEIKEIREPQSGEPLCDALFYWLETFKKPVLKQQSYQRLHSTIRNQIEPYLISHYPYQSITADELQKHIAMLDDKNYSYSVIKKAYDILNDFYRHTSRKYRFLNPMDLVVMPRRTNIKKDTHREVVFFEQNDIEKFITECQSTWKSSGRLKYQGSLMYAANIFLGLRIGELLALQWKDIDLEKNTISVTKTLIENYDYNTHTTTFEVQNSNKTETNRFIPINKRAKELITKHQKQCEFINPEDYVISTRNRNTTTSKNAYDTIKKIQENAGTTVQDGGTHILRHTCASLYFRKGISIEIIAKILGHSVEVCRTTYIHLVEEQLKNAASQINLD